MKVVILLFSLLIALGPMAHAQQIPDSASTVLILANTDCTVSINGVIIDSLEALQSRRFVLDEGVNEIEVVGPKGITRGKMFRAEPGKRYSWKLDIQKYLDRQMPKRN